jgi:signal peptidase II
MLTTFSSRPFVGVWYLFAASLVGLDQATKYAVQVLMPLRSSIEVTPFFNLVHVLNPGAAFSFLADAGGWQRHLFVGLGAAVSAFLAFVLWRGVRSRFETAAYIGLIGGALGNVIDRLRIGAVVDYLDFHWLGWHWPAFNLADIFVVSGTALLLLASMTERTGQRPLRVVEIKQRPNKEAKS